MLAATLDQKCRVNVCASRTMCTTIKKLGAIWMDWISCFMYGCQSHLIHYEVILFLMLLPFLLVCLFQCSSVHRLHESYDMNNMEEFV